MITTPDVKLGSKTSQLIGLESCIIVTGHKTQFSGGCAFLVIKRRVQVGICGTAYGVMLVLVLTW